MTCLGIDDLVGRGGGGGKVKERRVSKYCTCTKEEKVR